MAQPVESLDVGSWHSSFPPDRDEFKCLRYGICRGQGRLQNFPDSATHDSRGRLSEDNPLMDRHNSSVGDELFEVD